MKQKYVWNIQLFRQSVLKQFWHRAAAGRWFCDPIWHVAPATRAWDFPPTVSSLLFFFPCRVPHSETEQASYPFIVVQLWGCTISPFLCAPDFQSACLVLISGHSSWKTIIKEDVVLIMASVLREKLYFQGWKMKLSKSSWLIKSKKLEVISCAGSALGNIISCNSSLQFSSVRAVFIIKRFQP